MRVDLPTPGAYDALVLSGALSDAPNASAQMAVVLKAAYDLVEDGTGTRRMEPAADRAAALVLADEGRYLYPNPEHDPTSPDPDIPEKVEIPGPDFGFVKNADDTKRFFFMLGGAQHWIEDAGDDLVYDFKRESDLALAKQRTDVVVVGGGGAEAAVRIAGNTWLTRSFPVDPATDPDSHPPDVTRNLFGWQARQEEPRSDDMSDWVALANAYRRTTGFQTPGDRNVVELPSGATVELFANAAGSGDPTLSVRLPDLEMGLRLRVFCGHGPDEAPHWRIVPREDLVPDTLVLRPEDQTAEICWRRHWSLTGERIDAYRSVQIRAGGF
jgi:hypothetical protein